MYTYLYNGEMNRKKKRTNDLNEDVFSDRIVVSKGKVSLKKKKSLTIRICLFDDRMYVSVGNKHSSNYHFVGF